jgi:hypothetical protein
MLQRSDAATEGGLVRALAAVAVMALALCGEPRSLHAQGLMVSGYADFEGIVQRIGSTKSEFFFDNHHFNVIAFGRLFKDVFAAAEVEYEHAGEQIALEYGYLSYTGIKNLRISAGKFIVPFGRFNLVHPTWINKMPDRPLGFDVVLPETYSDVGVRLSGAAPLGRAARVTYDAFVVNGLLGEDGGNIQDMRDRDREGLTAGGRDNHKSFGGRLGLELPPQGFSLGASAYSGNYLDDPSRTLTLSLFGADAAYHYAGLELRAEGVLANQQATGGNLRKKGGYMQAAYLIGSRFEPVIRFSFRDLPGDAQDRRRLSFGASYYVSASSSVRLAYHINMEKTGFKSGDNSLISQFNVVF